MVGVLFPRWGTDFLIYKFHEISAECIYKKKGKVISSR